MTEAETFTYWLTFRFSDKSRDARIGRYNALVKLIENIDNGIALSLWKEPTSFYVIETPLNPEQLAHKLNSIIDKKKDIVLFCKIGIGVYYVVGTPADPDGLSLLPKIKYF